jgi:hypothetical protein
MDQSLDYRLQPPTSIPQTMEPDNSAPGDSSPMQAPTPTASHLPDDNSMDQSQPPTSIPQTMEPENSAPSDSSPMQAPTPTALHLPNDNAMDQSLDHQPGFNTPNNASDSIPGAREIEEADDRTSIEQSLDAPIGCDTGHTVGDFLLYRTCHLPHRTCQVTCAKVQVDTVGLVLPPRYQYTADTIYKNRRYIIGVLNIYYYLVLFITKIFFQCPLTLSFPEIALIMSNIYTKSLRLQSPKHNDARINAGDSQFRVK